MMKRLAGMMAGGLFNVKLEGTGMVAITTHHDPLTFRVTKEHPVFTDPVLRLPGQGTLNPR